MAKSKVCDLDEDYTRRGAEPVTVTLPGKLSEKVRDAAAASRCSSAAKWVVEAVEYMLMEHRVGKYRPDPKRFGNRNNEEEND